MPRPLKPQTARSSPVRRVSTAWVGLALAIGMGGGMAVAQEPAPSLGSAVDRRVLTLPPQIEESLLGASMDSVFGDAYAPGRWHPLSLRTFFTEGWDEAWACGPEGREGATPRHGWLGAFGGVFYRLWLTSMTYRHDLNTSYRGDGYAGDYIVFLPLSRRFEVALDVPFATGNGTDRPFQGYARNVGDLSVTPRFLLTESEATTQVVTLIARIPTGSPLNGNRTTSLNPRYEFWTNPFGSWVFRGGCGPIIPLNRHEGRGVPPTSLNGDLALGHYLRPNDVPFGDLVFYVACNFNAPLQGAAKATYAGLGPGTRFHIARNYFFLNYWEFPITGAHPQDYTMQAAFLKIF